MSAKDKKKLHKRNRNLHRYDLDALQMHVPELKAHCMINKTGTISIDFSHPRAVSLLNKAILHHYYEIDHWEFPEAHLCPAIPGRADYIHYMADLLTQENYGKLTENITCLDIGVGASCIYPIIGVVEYGWNFIGSDIDPESIIHARKIIASNPKLESKVECRLQNNPKELLQGIIKENDHIDLCISNPPFHSSLSDAEKATQRKNRNLHGNKKLVHAKNFSGNLNELVFEGGALGFIKQLIYESQKFSKKIFWFTCLVSQEAHLFKIYQALEKQKVNQIETIEMATGNKLSRIVAWTYLNETERKDWRSNYWNKRQDKLQ